MRVLTRVLACAVLAALALLAAAALAQPAVYVYTSDIGVKVDWREVPLAPHTSWVSSVSASLSVGSWETGYYNYSGWLVMRNAYSYANASFYNPKITVRLVFFKPGYVTVRYASLPQAGVSAAIIANCTGIPSAGGYTGGVRIATFTVSQANTLTPIGPYSFTASAVCLTFNATVYAGVYVALGFFYNYTIYSITALENFMPPLNIPLYYDLKQPRSYAYTLKSINVTAPRFLEADGAFYFVALNETYHFMRIADDTLSLTLTPVFPFTAYGIIAPSNVTLTTDFTQPATSTRFTIIAVEGELSTVKVNGTVLFIAPFANKTITVNPPSAPTPITFFISDYGQNYAALLAYDAHNRLVGSQPVSPATRSAVLNLTAYQNYVVTLWRPGEERVLGPVTVSQTQYYLNVPVPPPVWQPAPLHATAFYNATAGAYQVDVTCRNPPCTVALVKKWVTEPRIVTQEVELRPGTALAPHLFTWYFDGVDDYVFLGLLADNTGKPLTVYGWDALTVDILFNAANPKPATTVSFLLFSGEGAVGPETYITTLPSGQVWSELYFTFMAVQSDGTRRYFTHRVPGYQGNSWLRLTGIGTRTAWTMHVNGSFLNTVSVTGTTLLDYNPDDAGVYKPRFQRWSLGSRITGTANYQKALVSHIAFWRRALSSAEIAALQQYVVNATQLEAIFDPTWFNSTHYLSLLNGYVGKGYNGVARVPANQTWIWVIHGLHGDSNVHLRFMKGFTVVLAAVDSGSTYTFTPDSDDYAVSLPPGRYKVTVYVSGLKVEREEARYVCSEQQCKVTWFTSDPTLEVAVEDASGYVFTAVVGHAVGAQSWLRDIISAFVQEAGLSILGGEKFLLIFAALIIFILLSSAYEWRAGAIAAAAFLTAMQAWTGFDVVPATVTAILFALVVLDIIADWL